jgi:hypothetical protein
MKAAISRCGVVGLIGLTAVLLAPALAAVLFSQASTPVAHEGGAQAPAQIQSQAPEGWRGQFQKESAVTAAKLDAIEANLVEIREALAAIELLLELSRTEAWTEKEKSP